MDLGLKNKIAFAVKQPVENLILSNSTRAGITGFAQTLANEVAPFGITVNNILPGYTRSERLENLAEESAGRKGVSIEYRRSLPDLDKRHPHESFGGAGKIRKCCYVSGFRKSLICNWLVDHR